MTLLNQHLYDIIRRTLQLLTVLALLVLCFAFSAGSVSAKTRLSSVESPKDIIKNHHAPGRCLDADLNTIANNGTKVQLWDCNGRSQQSWAVVLNSDLSTVTIWNENSGRCLDADLNTIGSNGTKVQLWDCNGSSQQSWVVDGNPSTNNLQYCNIRAGRCLDADLNTIGFNGTKMQLWDFNGSSEQDWTGSDGRGA